MSRVFSADSTSASDSDFSVLTSAHNTSAPLIVIWATSVMCTPCSLNTVKAAKSSAPTPIRSGPADGHQKSGSGHARSVEVLDSCLRLRVVLAGAQRTDLGDVHVGTCIKNSRVREGPRRLRPPTPCRPILRTSVRSAASSKPPLRPHGTDRPSVQGSRRSSQCRPFVRASRVGWTRSTWSCGRCR